MPNNTIIFMSDEHNPLYSAPYGQPRVQTPNMTRLAEEGTLFRNAYCPSPLCLPSRSAFLSGKRVHEIQTYNNCNVLLDRTLPTYGDVLKDRGVHTVFMGKTHIYKPGVDMGFSMTAEIRDATTPGDINFIRQPLTIRKGAHNRADGYGIGEKAHARDIRVVDQAAKWLIETAPSAKAPWVLTVNVTAPHFPHVTTRELWDLYADSGDLPRYGKELQSAQHPYACDLRDHFETDHFTEEQTRGLRRGYLSCITFVDRQLGRLLECLEQTGSLSSTNVIYSSDHGEMLGKFGMWWKCSLYEDAIRIPCLARGPDFEAGKEVTTPVDLHDLRAAVFASAQTQQPAGWWGTPLQNIPLNNSKRVVFSEYHGHGTRAGGFMVRRGKWKLLYYSQAPNQLFDLETDPDELDNLYEIEPKTAKSLEDSLRSICDPEREEQRAREFIARQAEEVARFYPDARPIQ